MATSVVLPAIFLITLGIFGINTGAIRVALVLRAVFVRAIRLVCRGRVAAVVFSTGSVDCFNSIFVSLNAVIFHNGPLIIVVLNVSSL